MYASGCTWQGLVGPYFPHNQFQVGAGKMDAAEILQHSKPYSVAIAQRQTRGSPVNLDANFAVFVILPACQDWTWLYRSAVALPSIKGLMAMYD